MLLGKKTLDCCLKKPTVGISVLTIAARAALYLNHYMFVSCAAQISAKMLFCSLLLHIFTIYESIFENSIHSHVDRPETLFFFKKKDSSLTLKIIFEIFQALVHHLR